MDLHLEWFKPLWIGLAGGGLVTLIAKLVDAYVSKQNIKVNDNIDLRDTLIKERQSLIKEIGDLSAKIDIQYEEICKLQRQAIEVEKNHIKEVMALECRVKELETEVTNLKSEIIKMQKK